MTNLFQYTSMFNNPDIPEKALPNPDYTHCSSNLDEVRLGRHSECNRRDRQGCSYN